jgi:hypothetical protein
MVEPNRRCPNDGRPGWNDARLARQSERRPSVVVAEQNEAGRATLDVRYCRSSSDTVGEFNSLATPEVAGSSALRSHPCKSMREGTVQYTYNTRVCAPYNAEICGSGLELSMNAVGRRET